MEKQIDDGHFVRMGGGKIKHPIPFARQVISYINVKDIPSVEQKKHLF